MIGHRMPECIALYGQIQPKLRKVFRTESRVYVATSSGSGMWEAAVRNCVRDRVLHFVNGSFSDRWHTVSIANGKEADRVDVEWGQPILPELVAEHLAAAAGKYDAVAFAHNETSTGVTSPVKEIAAAIRNAPGGQDITIMIDSVSGMSGAEIEFDAWDLDIVLTGSQKAFALPPGLSFAAVSERAFEKAKTIPNRGFYFDYLSMEKSLLKDQTPATPAISLLFALNKQLDKMMAETMEGRWARHMALRDRTIEWALSRGFGLFADKAYASPTVTTVANDLGISIADLNKFLRTKGMILSNGYGKLKEKTFRIGHMGDWQLADMEELFATVDEYLTAQGIEY